jgi:FG-GAP-like repeat
VDLDRDGRRDILSGSYSRMEQAMAGLFHVLYGKEDGTFRRAEVLKGTDGEPLIIPVKGKPGEGDDWIKNICTRPFAADWDGDGHLDLVVGNFTGTFYLFKGQGKGQFQPVPEELKAGGQPLKIAGAHSDPFVIDWDGDGDLDLLSGSSEGGVQWAENRAGPGKPPSPEAFRPLIEKGPQAAYGQILREADLKGPVGNTRIWVDDVNSDGKLDILVGDMAHLISPADGLSEGEFQKKFADWTKSRQDVSARLNSEADPKKQAEAQRQIQELYERRTEFMKEDMTGFVWLYLRK